MNRDRSSKKRKTAAELVAELRSAPEFVAREQQREREPQANAQLYSKAAGPILRELNKAGFQVQSVGALRQSGTEYRSAISILLRWLPLVTYLPLKEEIVRALSVPWARSLVGPTLVDEFRRAEGPAGTGIRWAIANALEVVADEDVLEDLIELVRDPRYGRDREMLALALGNMSGAHVTSVLRDLLRDDEVVGHAAMALGRRRASEALPELQALTKHPRAWVRSEARKAVAKCEARNA